MNILSIDQSEMGKVGWAFFSDKKLENFGLHTYLGERSARKRLVVFSNLVDTLFQLYRPDIVVLEKVRPGHIATMVVLAGLIAIAEVTIPQDVPMWLVNPSTWKASVLGNGKASKIEAVAYVKQVYGQVVTHDTADAICLGYYIESHIRVNGFVTIKNCVELVK